MKKVFLTLTMLLLAFMGTVKAVNREVEVGTASATNSYIPTYTYYNYSVTQQIFTPAELQYAGTISAISFDVASGTQTRNLNVFMKHVTKSSFSSATDWEAMAENDKVFAGNISFAAGWVTVTLNTPFEYNGTDNLLLCVQDVTGTWASSMSFRVYAATNGALRVYRDASTYDVANMSGVSGTIINFKNHMKVSMEVELGPAAMVATPNPVDLGARPNGAWMKPATFTLTNDGGDGTVTAFDVNNNFFAVNTQVPFALPYGESKEVEIETGTATAGAQNGQILISFGDRNFTTVDVTAEAYDPETPDVWEKAQEVTSFPYSGTAPATIYKNYNILGAAADAKDAVYKVTVAEDAMLNVTVGNSGVSAIYNEDFDNVGGPDIENIYTYDGPVIGDGPINSWVFYEYTGSMTNYGYSSGDGVAFGYMIPASFLQENGMGNAAITTVEALAAGSSYPSTYYQLFILQGGDEPDLNNLVYVQDAEYTPGNYFDVDLEEPLFLGDEENIWVMFITDCNRMVCGRDPVDPTGGVWYSRDLATWMNSTDFTPILYTHFIEFNRGRDLVVNANLKIRELNGSTVGEMDATEATAKGVSRAQKYLAAKGNRADTPSSTVEGTFVPAGTYYVVAAATTAPFSVDITTAAVPVPEPAVVTNPEDAAFNVTAPLSIEWVLGNYTQEMQVLFGTQFPPTDILIDWTDQLVENANISTLLNNKTYFIQINERNTAGETASEIYGFTTPIDPVQGFAVASDKLYPGENAEFTWEANRTLQGYNLYMDGTLVNDELITATEYAVDSLDYNMTGYSFQISAKYGTGESLLSDPIVVKMTGFGSVSGTVYEQDETTVVPGITVEYRGTDEYGANQSFTFTTDQNGEYAGEVLAGTYQTYAYSDDYQETPGPEVTVAYGDDLDGIDIIVYEYYFPLGQIRATEQTEENNVLVEWDWTPGEMIVDFETGDFSQANFTLPATYPWVITSTNPYEGTYCMKSACEGVASGTSEIEATVDVPFDAKMGFYVMTSTESSWDKFFFYIDGVAQGAAISGTTPYTYHEYALSAGTHTYKWSYQKDSSVNSGDDCVYVDNITMYRQDVPAPPVVGGQDFNFDDGTLMGWTNIDADGDGNEWVSSTNPGIYHNAGVSLAGTGHNSSEAYVISGSYANGTGQVLYPDNYLVSPQISAQDGALIRFYACAQDESYAAEVFGVAVSTTGNTSAADFNTIQTWTMTAKGPQGSNVDAVRKVRSNRQGQWYEYSVDLSDYAGQDIYVAIRHYNCSDMFILNVDDITLATGGSKNIVRNDRSFQHFNLYRRDIQNGEEEAEIVCIAQPASDVFEYTDEAWASLPYGAYQWGIQAFYEGNAPSSKNRDVIFSDDFESGSLSNWTLIDNGYPTGEGWGYATPSAYDIGNAHSGVGVAASWSWNGYEIDQDAYMISPLVEGATTVNYFVATNTAYPDYYEIMTSSTGVNSSDFTSVFGEVAPASKGGNGQKYVKGNNNGNTRDMSVWVERTIDLPAGTKYVAFHHVDYDANYLFIDDVTISGGGSTPVIPTPTGDGLSEILWSNTIEKDMYSTVTVNVTLNNGQSPAGVSVALGDNTATMDESGSVVFENVRKGEYELSATMAEFADYNETVMINEDEQTINITLLEIVGPVADLYVSPTGWAMWSGATSGGTTPVGPVGPTTTVTYDFEADFAAQEILDWTTIDANNDGYDWYVRPTGLTTLGHNGSQGFVTSFSYDGTYGVTPDNYLVSPQGQYSSISFWACAQDAAYPSEKFGVAVSTAGNTNAADFTTLQSWTMTAKAPANKLERGMNDTGAWYEYTVDLSAYAGQNIYVAIRHYDCYDWFRLNVDDITLEASSKDAKGERAALSFKVMLDGAYEGETRNGYFQHNVEGFEEGSVHTTSVAAIYATGMGDWTDYTWTYTSCENFAGATNVTAEQSENVVNISWEMPDAPGPNPPTPPTPPTGDVVVKLTVGDVWGDGSGYQMLLDETHSLYGTTIPTTGALSTNCSGNEAIYAQFSHKIPENADGNCSTSNIVLNNSIEITIPAGTYDWCITNPTPGDRIWIAASNGNVGGRYDDYVFEGGKTYEFTVAMFGTNDGVDVTISGGSKYEQRSMGQDNSDCRVAENVVANRGNRAMWDFVNNFSGSSAGQQAVATDGTYIYTASWQETPTGGYTFYQYDLEGNFIEGFNIAGATGIRDLTTDGEYFYGSSGGAQIFCMDFTTRTLVSTINCSGLTSRHVSYDPERDGFWSGNWTTLALYSRTGALLQSGPAPTSAYGSAYYKDADDVEHLFLFCQTPSGSTNRVEVYDYNIASNTLSSGPVRVLSDIPGYNATDGIAGGCFVGSYNGQTCFFANVQQDPNLIGIYELDGNGTPGPGPTPSGEFGILGAYVFRNGELISGTTPLTTTTFVDTEAPAGDNEYCVRVVYDGLPDTSFYAMSCPVCAETEYECIPVNNLVANYTYNSADDYGVTLTWECEHADDVLYYNIYYSDTIVTGVTELEHYVEMTGNPGEYTYSVTAVYSNCESEPVYADVNVTSVNDINGKVVLYPNPTSSTVTIQAAGMKHITVVNALGQVVYDTDLTADMTQLNLGQYKPGVYMVRINTEEGVSVKRVTVVK